MLSEELMINYLSHLNLDTGCFSHVTHLGGQLLLPIHQALYIGRVVAAALAGRHSALECCSRNL